jgi:hypothetical protein
MDPLQRLLLGVSESSRDDDADLEEAEQPIEEASAKRKRRSRDRSFKKTARAQFHRVPRVGR